MGFEKSDFPYFGDYCIRKFGSELGQRVVTEAENKLARMTVEADDKNSKVIRWHLDSAMLPTIAMYLTFKEFEGIADKAYDYTEEVLQPARLAVKKKNQFLGKLPLSYPLFKMLCKSVMTKQYPEQGWDVQWMRYDREEIHFNMKSCIYYETTKKYHCPEMCPLFCANDDVTLSGYAPATIFERTGTIARGQDLCDFHFKNSKYIKQSK